MERQPYWTGIAERASNMSKLSFQYGFKVFLITEVVRVCSPPIVATANGSGNPEEQEINGWATE